MSQRQTSKTTEKVKTVENLTSTMDHYPGMDRQEMPILNLVCHANLCSGLYWNHFTITLKQVVMNRSATFLVRKHTQKK